MMKLAEMRELQPGDIVLSKALRVAYVVTANYGTRVTAVKTADITNPSEWEIIFSRRLTTG